MKFIFLFAVSPKIWSSASNFQYFCSDFSLHSYLYLLLLVFDARTYKPIEILTNFLSYIFIKLATVFCLNVILKNYSKFQ